MIDTYWCCSGVGQGYGVIHMRDVDCSSNSPSLFSCDYTPNSNGCDHDEDLGVQCYGKSCLLATIYN